MRAQVRWLTVISALVLAACSAGLADGSSSKPSAGVAPTTTAAKSDSPRKQDGGVVVDLRDINGREVCTSAPTETVTEGILAGFCGNVVYGFDLESLALTTEIKLGSADKLASWGAGGGLLAFVTRTSVDGRVVATGHAVDLRSGTEVWKRELSSALEVVGVSAAGTAAFDSASISACADWVKNDAVAFNRDGTVAWRADHIHTFGLDVAIVGSGNDQVGCPNAEPYVESFVAVDSGKPIAISGRIHTSPDVRCSPWVQSRTKKTKADPPAQFTNVTTGEVISVNDAGTPSFLREGVLLNGDGPLSLYGSGATAKWSMPAQIAGTRLNIGGRLVITDEINAHLLIDGSTGREVKRLLELPGELYDSGRWEKPRSGSVNWRPTDPTWSCPGPVAFAQP